MRYVDDLRLQQMNVDAWTKALRKVKFIVMLAGLNKMVFAKEAVVERSSLLCQYRARRGPNLRTCWTLKWKNKCVPQRTA